MDHLSFILSFLLIFSVTITTLRSAIKVKNTNGEVNWLRICSCLACVYRVMNARGKFGEHERCIRVARGDTPSATLASWVLSKLPESIHNSIYAQLKAWINYFITQRHQGSVRSFVYCDRAQNSHEAQKSKQTCLLAGQKHATFLFKFKFAKRATCKFFFGFIFAARWIRT